MSSARPAIVDELAKRAGRPWSREEMRAELAGEPEALGPRLRRLRERVMVALAHRDLNGLAPLAEVFDTMAALAEECIGAAAARAHEVAVAAHGEPAGGAALTVAALGKLGGAELNVSSDVDLVFLYGAEGETAGPRPIAHSAFFAAVGRSIIALLSEATEDGQAFRVDMRLRPFGDSGPLATSLPALEDYFIAHARPWERYAWLKARALTGDRGDELERLITPFVFRKYLDYDAYAGLRDVHRQIREQGRRKDYARNIKLGPGGIRELEFIVQALQLVRAGRE
ncbi:MAG TPA: bifunctional glutamine synthetase adenylyltransferase/deadenyltransferase, partial [Usitatibacter sp.]|nr:bifunctional glutamine synthetase adenylyltransferase/deadenyltransferase [Usitatibacter sp.]